MKRLADYANDINKCSKCGLCQAACPIYKLTGNDCAVSRGKFVMLDGVIKGDLQLNKNINKYLEMCLKCGKCTNFCPSGIDVCKIFRIAKHEYLKKSLEGKIIKFLQSRLIFDNLINLFNRKVKNNTTSNTEILYFKGCAEKIFPSNTKAVESILNYSGYKILEKDFQCCGVPFLASGNIERYKEAQKHNLDIINNYSGDYILTDCSSCESALNNYTGLHKTVINTNDFIVEQDLKFTFDKKYVVTFHKPCHLKNDNFLSTILKNCTNIEYREMKNYDECCGFAGQFAVTNKKLSKQLTRQKAKSAIATGADIILTTCPACILGIKEGLLQEKGLFGEKPKVMYISEFLAKATITR